MHPKTRVLPSLDYYVVERALVVQQLLYLLQVRLVPQMEVPQPQKRRHFQRGSPLAVVESLGLVQAQDSSSPYRVAWLQHFGQGARRLQLAVQRSTVHQGLKDHLVHWIQVLGWVLGLYRVLQCPQLQLQLLRQPRVRPRCHCHCHYQLRFQALLLPQRHRRHPRQKSNRESRGQVVRGLALNRVGLASAAAAVAAAQTGEIAAGAVGAGNHGNFAWVIHL
mmetsp:Transcript_21939/g.38847  ORF Transcript_21939/g.38847 Transcript_21939/m.38847 type:complete len:221 (+) Transcript_21939:681-1343(+)